MATNQGDGMTGGDASGGRSNMSGSEGGSQGARTDRGNQNDEGIGSSATRTAGTAADDLGGTQNAGGKTGSQPNRGSGNASGDSASGRTPSGENASSAGGSGGYGGSDSSDAGGS